MFFFAPLVFFSIIGDACLAPLASLFGKMQPAVASGNCVALLIAQQGFLCSRLGCRACRSAAPFAEISRVRFDCYILNITERWSDVMD